MKYDDIKTPIMGILSNKKYQWMATIFILILVLFIGSSIRLSNWNLLTDHTTGEKIPLALDPFYWLREAKTIIKNNGTLPAIDNMRAPGFNIGWSPELLPRVIVWMWEASNFFGHYTIQAVDIFSPVFFFGIGIILFFILVYVLTKSKFAGVIATIFLSFTPAYLYRTMGGFADHDSMGMAAFFLVMLGFVLIMKVMEKMKKRKLLFSGIYGIIVGLLSVIAALSWGGVAVFVFMIIPVAFGLIWITKLKDGKNVIKDNGLSFYLTWIVSSILWAALLGLNFSGFIHRYIISSNDIISLAVLGFIIIDRILISFGKFVKGYNEKYRIIYSAIILGIFGIVSLPFIGKNFFSLVWGVFNKLLNPAWNDGRIDSTVAENAQPYLVNWINNMGIQLFWLFVAGATFVGIEFSKNIKHKPNRYLLVFGFVTMISGILFSRISSNSVLNGSGIFTLSGLIYLGGVGIFIYAFLKNYLEGGIPANSVIIILFSWMAVMLVVGRSTTRLFFAIAPLVSLLAGYFIVKTAKLLITKKHEEISTVILIGMLIISVGAGVFGVYTSYTSISSQAKYTGPSANAQWQNAMKWVREDTPKNALFVHWWDYGYWVQELGKRATVADGGHAEGAYNGDYKIGRYVLTTPNPATALSFFKTMNTSYLLIDQSDLGKYPAYSKIGGGNVADGNALDRYSAIPVMPADLKQTRETANGTTFVFSGGMYLFEDIDYSKNGSNVFLPSGKAVVIGIIISINNRSLQQPKAVYIYNNIQTRIPIRYVYLNGRIIDFKSGLNAVIDIIPAFDGRRINRMGAAIYLSQKVSKSLFSQLYLLNDSFGEYKTLRIAHIEDNPIVKALGLQDKSLGHFIYYKGFRGPIKIWNISKIPSGINVVNGFKSAPTGTYGALDSANFGTDN